MQLLRSGLPVPAAELQLADIVTILPIVPNTEPMVAMVRLMDTTHQTATAYARTAPAGCLLDVDPETRHWRCTRMFLVQPLQPAPCYDC